MEIVQAALLAHHILADGMGLLVKANKIKILVQQDILSGIGEAVQPMFVLLQPQHQHLNFLI